MKLPSFVKSMFTINDSILDEQFSLVDENQTSANQSQDSHRRPSAVRKEKAEGGHANTDTQRDRERRTSSGQSNIKPIPMKDYVKNAEEESIQKQVKIPDKDEQLPTDLEAARAILKHYFHLPENADILLRDFTVGTEEEWPALAVFVDGMADKNIINTHILQPLMILTHINSHHVSRRIETVSSTLLPGNQISEVKKWQEVIDGVLSGSTVVLVDGCDSALVVESKGWEHRTVGITQTESVVKGPHDAFTEMFRANTGLVRARLRSPDLVTEMMSVGKLGKTDIAIMYIKNLTNPRLVDEIRKRIEDIDIDYLADSGLLEQFLEDNPRVWLPQTLSTERPDRIAHMLTEGHVAIFAGNSPYVIAAPVVFWSLVHSPEDAYLRFPFGSFLRLIRWIAIIVALLTPALYVSITNYHPEMIPTDLLLAIASSREQVPFPAIIEILLMEFAIELIREAGIRIPTVIGPTIGIVGALIIGQAAVQAGVVSPLLVIVIAVTALASFTIPNYNLAFGIRIMRFILLFVAALFGFYGVTLAMSIIAAKMSVQKSLGVPLLSPVAPSMDSSPDVVVRGPGYVMNQRPTYLRTLNSRRQDPITRPWSSVTRKSVKQNFDEEGDK